MATILVAIAAYNESHVEQTVKSIIENKSNENDVFVNVCEFRTDDKFSDLEEYPAAHKKYRTSVPTGVGIPRYMAMENSACFDYVLQCDAHMILGKNWDSEIVLRYEAISNACENEIVISQHVSPCMEGPEGFMVPIRKNEESSFLFLDEHFRVWSKNWVPRKKVDWMENRAVSAAYMFSASKTFSAVPPDPHMWFYGEELSIYFRLISRGIRSFSTDYLDIYHLDKGDKFFDAKKSGDWRTIFVHDAPPPVLRSMDSYTTQRVASIFDGTLTGLWGAPDQESAKMAVDFIGIDLEKFKKTYRCS
jgi:hypothetical protein